MRKCKKHPRYKGIFKPRVECEQCEAVYARKQMILRGDGAEYMVTGGAQEVR